MDNYFGIFDCYSPRRGCERTLIMSGMFNPDDMYNVALLVDHELSEMMKV